MSTKRVDIHLKNGQILKLRVDKLEWKGDARTGELNSLTWRTVRPWYWRRTHPAYISPSEVVAIVEHTWI